LRYFSEKAILRLGGSFIPSGDLIQITVPPVLKNSSVASRYENVTFSRKTATRKRNVDLLGIGHPLIDALVDYYKSESVSGELLNAKCDGIPSCLNARCLFTVEFEDGTRRELYHSFVIEGEGDLGDLDFLLRNDFNKIESKEPVSPLDDKLRMFIKNQVAQIRSNYERVINIRQRCIGILAID